jgi:hypothetical protein
MSLKKAGEYETRGPDLIGPLVQLAQQRQPFLQLDVGIRFGFFVFSTDP